MDRVSKRARSRIMSLVKSRHGKTTEGRLRACLAGSGVSGWVMNYGVLPGKPDFAFVRERLAVFVDGCFWHGCNCKRLSKTRKAFWAAKVHANQNRDRHVVHQLRAHGWSVMRIKECELKSVHGRTMWLERIKTALRKFEEVQERCAPHIPSKLRTRSGPTLSR